MDYQALFNELHLFEQLLALLVGVVLAWRGTSMFLISGLCCVTVFLAELMIP